MCLVDDTPQTAMITSRVVESLGLWVSELPCRVTLAVSVCDEDHKPQALTLMPKANFRQFLTRYPFGSKIPGYRSTSLLTTYLGRYLGRKLKCPCMVITVPIQGRNVQPITLHPVIQFWFYP